MDSQRIEGIARLSGYRLNTSDPSYLHLRSLFADLEKASSFAQGRLLDIGCGNKPYQKMFEGKISEHVGCDIVQSSEQRADVICPATQIPLDDASFDTILCTQVIEHVADHRALLNEANRLLRNGGVLILSGPMYWPLHEEPYDFFRFTCHGFREILKNAGFKVHSLQSNGGKWALCGQVLIHTFEGTKLYRRSVVRLINKACAFLDDRRRSCVNTMNYVIVAYKSSD
jgi:SAM-dependent methyltransferase